MHFQNNPPLPYTKSRRTLNHVAARIQTIDDLHGPAGHLEALLNSGPPGDSLGAAPFAALVCHPHPPTGGTMHNKVVFHTMKALTALGIPTLRFNFRGVGLSEGVYDHGLGERDDVRAAVDWLDSRFHLPILFAGFSFGAAVGLHACVTDPRVAALIALGLPIRTLHRSYDYTFLAPTTQPKFFLSGDQDQYAPSNLLHSIVDRIPAPKSLELIPNADHFFNPNQLPAMQAALTHWLRQTFPASFPPA